MDLTTLEGKDTPGKVRQMCQKALLPLDTDPSIGPVAAVCVYPNLVPTAKKALRGSNVKVASVATAFPSGQSPLDVKLDDVRRAVELRRRRNRHGDRSRRDALGRLPKSLRRNRRNERSVRRSALESDFGNGRARVARCRAQGKRNWNRSRRRFHQTSTGKIVPAATPSVTLVMLEAIRDHHHATGRKIGMKPAGGIRTAKQALHYLVIVKETLGDAWLTPDLFRFGASTLLNDVLMQLEKERTGFYQASEDFRRTEDEEGARQREEGNVARSRFWKSVGVRAGAGVAGSRQAEVALRALHRRQVAEAAIQKYFDTISPSTEEKIAEVADADAADVDAAVVAARRAHEKYWAKMPGRNVQNTCFESHARCKKKRASSRSSNRWTAASRSKNLATSTFRSRQRTFFITRVGPTSSSTRFTVGARVRSASPDRSFRGISRSSWRRGKSRPRSRAETRSS